MIKQLLARAIREAESIVVQVEYTDVNGVKTIRVISPIKFIGQDRVSALCLGREEPRTFVIARMSNAKSINASDVLMPVPIEEVEKQ